MTFAKLCQRLAADQKRYKEMTEKGQRSLYGRFIFRRIRKTSEKINTIARAIGTATGPGGNYHSN